MNYNKRIWNPASKISYEDFNRIENAIEYLMNNEGTSTEVIKVEEKQPEHNWAEDVQNYLELHDMSGTSHQGLFSEKANKSNLEALEKKVKTQKSQIDNLKKIVANLQSQIDELKDLLRTKELSE